jgi:hypothetical protein
MSGSLVASYLTFPPADPGLADNGDDQVLFKLTAQLNKLTIAIDRATRTPEDVKRLMEAQRNTKVSEEDTSDQ